VHRREPTGVVRPWLENRDAIWVASNGFDELMLLVRNAFDLPQPDARRFDGVFQRYFDAYETLSGRVQANTDPGPAAEGLRAAARRTDESFVD